ncbi:hypothetical protein BOX15_Mlig005841g1 [Macrostomum lignano]|uniref:LRRCT domain-containing protein n=1 Tax=Macrostomum lignano TaxID=282301 RepID=A0A267DFR0_9PLAT|nr:hypothetical protein BOX15_Mlig005841g3 [Macrostomum lignano]PAA63176.1 hypothetical protein BOX15_Mlig005841g1 [Macrostomum lignano]
MSKVQLLLGLLLPILIVGGSTYSESLSCAFIRGDAIQLYQCGSLEQFPADVLPSPMLVEQGLPELRVPDTGIVLFNATLVRPQPSPLSMPAEVRRCGLADLGNRLSGGANGSGLLLNFSGMSLRFGGHGEFDGLSPPAATWLDLSRNLIDIVPSGVLDSLPNLVALDLSWNRIEHLDKDTFCSIGSTLRWLDLRGNPMLATYALPVLHSLEWLDASLSKILTGSFCRMASLRRVTMHGTVERLNCFVFDSLPNLTELSLTYKKNAKNICQTMMCDPHPVLGSPVPFNFSLTRVITRSNGSVNFKAINFYLRNSSTRILHRQIYKAVCTDNYEHYLTYHNRSMPATLGCLSTVEESPACPKSSPVFACMQPKTPPTSAGPTTGAATKKAATNSNPVTTDSSTALVESVELVESTAPSTVGAVVEDSDSANHTGWKSSSSNSVAANKIKEALAQQRIRSMELENEILRLELVIKVVYSVSTVLFVVILLLAGHMVKVWCRQTRQRRRNFGRDQMLSPEQHPLYQTGAASKAAETEAAVAATDAAAASNCDQELPQPGSDAENDYLPMRDPVYTKLPDVFPNPIYGRSSKA